ncbi:MAG: DNA translocase FtsK [Ruminococcaceae bacterium]|nr:DNA translocase FtsK [Oscillospiraceae bacterium]
MAQKKIVKKTTKPKVDAKTKKADTSAKTSKKSAENEEQTATPPISYIVWVLVFAAIGLLIFLSMIVNIVSHFNGETALLGYITEPIMGLFGICTPAIGAYSLAYAYFCFKYRNDLPTKNAKGVLLILNLVFLLGTLHLINTLWVDVPVNPKDLWASGIHWQGCGLIGGYLGWFLSKLLHKSIGLIFGLLVYFVCLIFFCGGSPLDVLKSFGKRINCFFRYIVSKTKQSFAKRAEEKAEEKSKHVQHTSTKPAEDQKKISYSAKEEQKPFLKEEKTEEPTNVSTYPKERTENYVTGSIYDAPIRKETSKEKTEEESSEIGEKVKNKFGFKMGREARDDGTAEVPTDDVSFEPDSKIEEEPIAITGEQTEIVPTDSIETPVYITPPMDLLKAGDEETSFNSAEVEQKKRILLETLEAFRVKADVVNISCGPTITRYEIEPEIGVSVKSIEKLGKDLALRLAAKSLRIEAPIPGKCAVGIEVSNNDRLTVKLRDILDSPIFKEHKSKLFCCLGVDVAGNAVYLDIPKMPHLLIAGATGMGKSVCLNCLIVSLLYRATPEEVRLILIDPKKVEFSHYADIPHLLAPVVTNINKCAGTLNWAVAEMERRYDIFEAHSLRNLEEYQAQTADDPEAERLASIVIVIDELADLMMQAKAEVETSICRLAQKARAAGMYLILGTQRPSVDVITGLIKANIPSRISLAVSSQVDSRTILDSAGAENLLDKGDILYAPAGARKALRVQGAFISTKELNSVCEFVRSNSKPQYDPDVVKNINTATENYGKSKKGKSDEDGGSTADTKDLELMIAALEVGFEQGTVSTSYIQRRLSFGYAKAARVVDMLQQHGFVSAPDPVNKLRKIIISPQELAELKMNGAISKKDNEESE